MWLLLACAGGPDSSEDSVVESTSTTVEVYQNPWDEQGFWTEEGPLSPMLETSHRPPTPFWAVWLATSSDGQNWTASEFPLSLGLSSLHLLVVEEGVLITGVVDRRQFEREGLELPAMNQIYALVSADLKTWGSHAWAVSDAASKEVIDPGLYLDLQGGLHAAWFGSSSGNDPAQEPGPHPVRGGTWNGTDFTTQTEDLFAKEWLADPAICRIDGSYRLFYTEQSQRIRMATSEDGILFEDTPGFEWDEVTVPWCREEQDHLVLLGQTVGGAGPAAQMQVNADGTTENMPSPYQNLPFDAKNCTSLAVASFKGQWLLLCASDYE